MSNLGLKKFCEQNEINFSETKVGDRYVLERMKKEDYVIGGEQSGHVIFLDYSTTGDGQLTAVQFLNVLSKSKKKASELNQSVKKYPQKSTTVNIKREQKGLLARNETIVNFINNKNAQLNGCGRLVVRESGTEPKIRIMAELDNEEKLQELLNEATNIISENI
jgi:phosphoglucosamine mutase